MSTKNSILSPHRNLFWVFLILFLIFIVSQFSALRYAYFGTKTFHYQYEGGEEINKVYTFFSFYRSKGLGSCFFDPIHEYMYQHISKTDNPQVLMDAKILRYAISDIVGYCSQNNHLQKLTLYEDLVITPNFSSKYKYSRAFWMVSSLWHTRRLFDHLLYAFSMNRSNSDRFISQYKLDISIEDSFFTEVIDLSVILKKNNSANFASKPHLELLTINLVKLMKPYVKNNNSPFTNWEILCNSSNFEGILKYFPDEETAHSPWLRDLAVKLTNKCDLIKGNN